MRDNFAAFLTDIAYNIEHASTPSIALKWANHLQECLSSSKFIYDPFLNIFSTTTKFKYKVKNFKAKEAKEANDG